jgi:hypothetical protein
MLATFAGLMDEFDANSTSSRPDRHHKITVPLACH